MWLVVVSRCEGRDVSVLQEFRINVNAARFQEELEYMFILWDLELLQKLMFFSITIKSFRCVFVTKVKNLGPLYYSTQNSICSIMMIIVLQKVIKSIALKHPPVSVNGVTVVMNLAYIIQQSS